MYYFLWLKNKIVWDAKKIENVLKPQFSNDVIAWDDKLLYSSEKAYYSLSYASLWMQ